VREVVQLARELARDRPDADLAAEIARSSSGDSADVGDFSELRGDASSLALLRVRLRVSA